MGFKNAVEIVPSAAEAFSSGAYAGDGRPYKIILAEPNNQDWDLETVLNKEEILQPSDPFYYDSTNNEIMIVVYPSAPARNRAQGEMYQHAPDVFGRLSSSFECVVCAVLEINYHPSFYGPFP